MLLIRIKELIFRTSRPTLRLRKTPSHGSRAGTQTGVGGTPVVTDCCDEFAGLYVR